jgi:ribosome-binding protein aMBF1 (putative translation factor)
VIKTPSKAQPVAKKSPKAKPQARDASSAEASQANPPKRGGALSPRGRGSSAALPASDPDQLLRLFADNMRRIRKSKDLSQEALADLCDLDRTYISGIERKRRNLSIRNIQRIAEALGVDPRVLLEPVAS